MAVGLIFIMVGILIVVFPKLLSLIVAAFLIIVGATLASMSWHFKKAKKAADNPFVNFFIRF